MALSLPHLSLFLLAALGGADSPAAPASLPPPPPEWLRPGFQAIEEADLRAWVGFLASPELEGRESGRPGYELAARFCATFFEAYGLKPAGGGGSFFQEFPGVREEPDLEASWIEVSDPSGVERFPLPGHAARDGRGPLLWELPWCFAGFGEGPDSDAPASFAGLPVGERVVMVLSRPGERRWNPRAARAAGVKRVAVVSDERVSARRGLSPRERPLFDAGGQRTDAPEVLYISRRVADRVLRGQGLSVEALLARKDALPRLDLPAVEMRVVWKERSTPLVLRNVVALLEGSHSRLKEEVVSIGAHLDHVGKQEGTLHPGADDDASGVAGVLAVARAFSRSPRRPARSVLFLLFDGEEKGLWGSRYFVGNPPFPRERFLCHFQMDMVGRDEEHGEAERAEANRNSVHLVGADRRSRHLHRAVLDQNRWVGLDLEFDEERVFDRSDQISFAEKGVPVAFFFTGFHRDYHQPTDTPEKLNYPKLARILRLVYASACDLADRQEPLWRSSRF